MQISDPSRPVFDAVARDYDAIFTETAVGRLLRARVWALLGRETARKSVLELNCGTGTDAVWLAKEGWQVLATDISPEMVAATNAKIAIAGLEARARAEVCGIEEIGRLHPSVAEGEGPGLIFSNFGGLNCLSPVLLKKLATDLQLLMQPGSCFIAVVMSRFCWWETLYFLLKGKPRDAFRRLTKGPVNASLDEKTTVPTWYYSPGEFRRLIQAPARSMPRWTVRPLGFWLPPSYLNPFFEKHPRLLRLLNILEQKFAPAWVAPLSDHFFICLKSSEEGPS